MMMCIRGLKILGIQNSKRVSKRSKNICFVEFFLDTPQPHLKELLGDLICIWTNLWKQILSLWDPQWPKHFGLFVKIALDQPINWAIFLRCLKYWRIRDIILEYSVQWGYVVIFRWWISASPWKILQQKQNDFWIKLGMYIFIGRPSYIKKTNI